MSGLVIGTVSGTVLFTVLAPDWLVVVLGALICTIVLMDAFRAIEHLTRFVDLRSRRLASAFSLIGGVIARVGALMFDGSLRTQLNQLRASLTKGQ